MRVLAFDGASPALERQWDVMEAAGGVEPYVFGSVFRLWYESRQLNRSIYS